MSKKWKYILMFMVLIPVVVTLSTITIDYLRGDSFVWTNYLWQLLGISTAGAGGAFIYYQADKLRRESGKTSNQQSK